MRNSHDRNWGILTIVDSKGDDSDLVRVQGFTPSWFVRNGGIELESYPRALSNLVRLELASRLGSYLDDTNLQHPLTRTFLSNSMQVTAFGCEFVAMCRPPGEDTTELTKLSRHER